MEYRIAVQQIEGIVSRDIDGAVEELTKNVNTLLASGWECQGGIAIGSAGTAPYLWQALVKR